MNDKELLELAANTAGIDATWSDKAQAYRWHSGADWVEWNPLNDDGDALRLAVDAGILVAIGDGRVTACPRHPYKDCVELFHWASESHVIYAATRRAIVCAAAEIAKESHMSLDVYLTETDRDQA